MSTRRKRRYCVLYVRGGVERQSRWLASRRAARRLRVMWSAIGLPATIYVD